MQFSAMRERLIANHKTGLCTIPSNNPGLVYTLTPNKCGFNSKGYRDYEYDYNKDSNAFRIVVIGDSVAYGHGLGPGEAFPKYLERNLNRTINDERREVQVISLARGGYTTSQELIILEQEAFQYDPDLIVWSYVLNDPGHTVFANDNHRALYHFEPRFHLEHFFMKSLYKIRERIMRSSCDKAYFAFLHCVYWESIESNLGKVYELARDHGTPVLFLIHPMFGSSFDYNSYPLAALHNQLGGLASDLGFEVLDLTQAYLPYDPVQLALKGKNGLVDPVHPNKKGSDIAASYLFAAVIENETFGSWAARKID